MLLSVAGLILLLFFTAGCAPSTSMWRESMDGIVGDNIDIYLTEACGGWCISLWGPVNRNRTVDKIVDEGSDKRYYLSWNERCKYSVLISPSHTVISWRYETTRTKSCYVF
jgi:hypothetical protein